MDLSCVEIHLRNLDMTAMLKAVDKTLERKESQTSALSYPCPLVVQCTYMLVEWKSPFWNGSAMFTCMSIIL